jgi:hypothetical protein
MNNEAGGQRRLRQAGTLAIATAITLLATACGGGSPSSSSTSNVAGAKSAGYAAQLAYSRCMRSHGVPDFPDPQHNASGTGISVSGGGGNQGVDTSSPEYQSASSACRHLLPNGGAATSQQANQGQLNALLNFSRCMRSHGVPNFPDPVVINGSITWNINGNSLDLRSPQAQAAQRACQSLLPAGTAVPGAGAPAQQGGAAGQGSGS